MLLISDLFHAYTPLVLWAGLGVILVQFLPPAFPRWLGRSLYWVGVPVEIFALAHQTDFSGLIWLAPAFTGVALFLGMGLALLSLQGLQRLPPFKSPADSLFLEAPGSAEK